MNFNHGVTASRFKMMAGFNLHTGLVGRELHDLMSQAAKARGTNGLVPGSGYHGPGPDYHSLEGKEHGIKARALLANETSDRIKSCRYCGKQIQQPMVGQRLYCDDKCRQQFYDAKRFPLVCSRCGANFEAKAAQRRRAERGLPVFCSTHCRQINNSQYCPQVIKARERRIREALPLFVGGERGDEPKART
jgi:hypothetical protein